MADDSATAPGVEEPLFDPSLKKKKKKKVTIVEDPLGVDGGAEAPTHNFVSAKYPPVRNNHL